MIESLQLRKYLIKYYMRNSKLQLQKVASLFVKDIQNKCFLNEKVVFKTGTNQAVYTLTKIIKEKNKILLVNETESLEVNASEVQRAHPLTTKDMLFFLGAVTEQTPFGPILIEGIIEKMSDQHFLAGLNAGIEERYKQDALKRTGSTRMHKHSVPVYREENTKKMQVTKAAAPVKLIEKFDAPAKLTPFLLPEFSRDEMGDFISIAQFLTDFDEMFAPGVGYKEIAEGIKDGGERYQKILINLIEFLKKDGFLTKPKANEFVLVLVEAQIGGGASGAECIKTPKALTALTLENCKAQVKQFITNLCVYLDTQRPVIFTDLFLADRGSLRLKFLRLLCDFVMTGDIFRDHVTETSNTLKTYKAKLETLTVLKKKMDDPATHERATFIAKDLENYDFSRKWILSPSRTCLGYANDQTLFVWNKKGIMLRDNKTKEHYLFQSRQQIREYMDSLDKSNKSHRTVHVNLAEAVDYLMTA